MVIEELQGALEAHELRVKEGGAERKLGLALQAQV